MVNVKVKVREAHYRAWALDVREALAIGYAIGNVNAQTLRRMYASKYGMAQTVRILADMLTR